MLIGIDFAIFLVQLADLADGECWWRAMVVWTVGGLLT